jgi:hypothetical protein
VQLLRNNCRSLTALRSGRDDKGRGCFPREWPLGWTELRAASSTAPAELRRGFDPTVLAVFDDWFEEGAVFEELYQTGSHMIDVVAHRSLGAFSIIYFEGLQDRQMGI